MGKPKSKTKPALGRQHKKQNDPFKVKNAGKKLKSSRKRNTVKTLKSDLELLDEAFSEVHGQVTRPAGTEDSSTAKVPSTDHSTSGSPPTSLSTSRPPTTVEDDLNQTIAHLSGLLPS